MPIVKRFEPSESKDILKKSFINLTDFYILLGKQCEQNRLMFKEIKLKIKNDLAKKGKRLPDSDYVPLNLVLDYLKDRRKLLDAVTISGGEPTLQKDLKDFIVKVKSLGYKVKLDTNGTNPEALKLLIEQNLIDYVAMDIKTNFDDYACITGLKTNLSSRVKESLNVLRKSGINYELRTTLVNEFHNEVNIEKMKEDLKGERVLYLQKFVDSGALISDNLSEVPKQQANKFKNILSETIKNVSLRGYS